jgi:hypothetical protein
MRLQASCCWPISRSASEIHLPGDAVEVERLMAMRLDPLCCFHRTVTVAHTHIEPLAVLTRYRTDERGSQQHARLANTDIAPAIGCGARDFSPQRQSRQRWHPAQAPDFLVMRREGFKKCWFKAKCQACVTPDVTIVGANILVACGQRLMTRAAFRMTCPERDR